MYAKYFKDYKNVHYYCLQIFLYTEIPAIKILDMKQFSICTNVWIINKYDMNKEVAFGLETQEKLDLLKQCR